MDANQNNGDLPDAGGVGTGGGVPLAGGGWGVLAPGVGLGVVGATAGGLNPGQAFGGFAQVNAAIDNVQLQIHLLGTIHKLRSKQKVQFNCSRFKMSFWCLQILLKTNENKLTWA